MIPESQLQSWAAYPGSGSAQATYASVRRALELGMPAGRRYDTYLQGSYGCDTNIRGDSDVDIIAEYQGAFVYDRTQLSLADQQVLQGPGVAYGWAEFRQEVLGALRAYYGNGSVHERNKCITVDAGSGRLSADVVAAIEHRLYLTRTRTVDGISFWTIREHRKVVNYPRQHRDNASKKNAATSQRFKPAARMFKNARRVAVDRGYVGAQDAPSYFLQCFIYNAPNGLFAPALQSTYTGVLAGLATAMNIAAEAMVCENEVERLFGPTPEQWNVGAAVRTLTALRRLWDSW